MHDTLSRLVNRLDVVKSQLASAIPNDEPFGNAHNNWSFPAITRSELIEYVESTIELINDKGGDDLGTHEARLTDYIRRLDHLCNYTISQIWGNAGQALPAFMFTIQGLEKALKPVLVNDLIRDTSSRLKRIGTQVRSMESRINGLDPRTRDIMTMVDRIEKAYTAAEQLPTDLESLSEAKQTIQSLLAASENDKAMLTEISSIATKIEEQLKTNAKEAESVLERCETAYSAATSVGLAAAFSKRSNSLSKSMWFWVAGLATALSLGSYFGSSQLRNLSELFKTTDASASIITLNIILSILSVGAPIWFAWLSTKQIGQRFRLSEDYAFKASISQAYEGFRREAARFDKDMEARLLESALTRLDELPLRLVENTTHGSPWHELASSDLVKQAIKVVPGFVAQINELASNSLNPKSRNLKVVSTEDSGIDNKKVDG